MPISETSPQLEAPALDGAPGCAVTPHPGDRAELGKQSARGFALRLEVGLIATVSTCEQQPPSPLVTLWVRGDKRSHSYSLANGALTLPVAAMAQWQELGCHKHMS